MLGTKRAVWLATQVIRNNAVRPSPARQMDTLFVCEPLARRRGQPLKTNTHEDNEYSRSFDQR